MFTLRTNGIVVAATQPAIDTPGGVLSSCTLFAAALLDPMPNPPIVVITDEATGVSWPPIDLRQHLITAEEERQTSQYGMNDGSAYKVPGWIVQLMYKSR